MGELESDIYRVVRPFLLSIVRHLSFSDILKTIIIGIFCLIGLFLLAVAIEFAKVIAAGDFRYLAKGIGRKIRGLFVAREQHDTANSASPTVNFSSSRAKGITQSSLLKYRPSMSISTRYGLILPTVMLIVAWIGEWPYNFYVLLRWIVCLSTAHLIFSLYRNQQRGWLIPVAAVCLLFNPFTPFRFDRETWATFNLLAAIFLAFVFASATNKKQLVLEDQLHPRNSSNVR